MMPQKHEDVNVDLPDFTVVLQETKQILRECFAKFHLHEVFLAFNGGKDCTVLLDVTIDVLREMHQTDDAVRELKVVYIRTNSPFEEIERFVRQIEMHYAIELVVVEGEMKATLQRILDQDKRLKACLMGTRRTDPYSINLQFLQKTDANWPQLVRISPLLNWSYHHIWSYVLQRHVPYCNLYDKGYTSIGSTNNTWPNPSLAYKDCTGLVSYLPAWHLEDSSLERAGRGSALNPTLYGQETSNHHDVNKPMCNGTIANGDIL